MRLEEWRALCEQELSKPYLWSFSNHYTREKFIADYQCDPEFVFGQCGAAVMLRSLTKRTKQISEQRPRGTINERIPCR